MFQPRTAHVKILDALYRYQVLTTELVAGAVGSIKSLSTVKPNIQQLEKHGYLSRFTIATPLGNSPYVCVLAEKGMTLLRDDYGYDMRHYKPPSEWKAYSTEYLMHPLERNKIVISANKITACDPHIQLSDFQLDYELKTNPFQVIEPNGVVHRVINDIVLQFTITREQPKRRIVLVELERSTHGTKAFLDKIRGLYFVARNGVFEDRYNHPIPRIALISTIDNFHVSWMKEQTKVMLQDVQPGIKSNSIFNRMFHLRLLPSLQGGAIDISNTFLETSWLHPLDTQSFSLLDI